MIGKLWSDLVMIKRKHNLFDPAKHHFFLTRPDWMIFSFILSWRLAPFAHVTLFGWIGAYDQSDDRIRTPREQKAHWLCNNNNENNRRSLFSLRKSSTKTGGISFKGLLKPVVFRLKHHEWPQKLFKIAEIPKALRNIQKFSESSESSPKALWN